MARKLFMAWNMHSFDKRHVRVPHVSTDSIERHRWQVAERQDKQKAAYLAERVAERIAANPTAQQLWGVYRGSEGVTVGRLPIPSSLKTSLQPLYETRFTQHLEYMLGRTQE